MYELQLRGDLWINGDPQTDADLHCEIDDDFSVQLSINEEGYLATWHCSECGEESTEEDMPDPMPCPGSGNWHRCTHCGASKKCSMCEGVKPGDCTLCGGSGRCDECDDDGDIEVHRWERLPLHWINSVGFTTDPVRDRVYLDVSLGDPRGCLRMEVRRTDDGRIFLHVPYVGMSQPHVPLTDVSPGTMEINALSHN